MMELAVSESSAGSLSHSEYWVVGPAIRSVLFFCLIPVLPAQVGDRPGCGAVFAQICRVGEGCVCFFCGCRGLRLLGRTSRPRLAMLQTRG